uniref:Putative ovule protein n=1 Tax=Solanum chacoense TaxID=4108 RepID=A0A0V0HZD2_SOLCH
MQTQKCHANYKTTSDFTYQHLTRFNTMVCCVCVCCTINTYTHTHTWLIYFKFKLLSPNTFPLLLRSKVLSINDNKN